MDCSIVITDQYYENNCYHVTMASEGKDLMISCQHFVDSHVLEASATQITRVRVIYDPQVFAVACSDSMSVQ